MRKFELLDHTADAKFRAYGKTREEAFANVVPALAAIATDKTVEEHQSYDVTVHADDLQGLLFDFIDSIIYLIDTEHFLPVRAEKIVIQEGYSLTATLVGDDVRKYGCNLKAPTYSEMIVEQDGDWMIQAVVDI